MNGFIRIFAGMDITATIEKLNVALSVTEKEELAKELAQYLNYLALNDFTSLVQILYRVDIPEQKIRSVLKENTQASAGEILAELLIERQQQKLTLKMNTPPAEDIPDEERW